MLPHEVRMHRCLYGVVDIYHDMFYFDRNLILNTVEQRVEVIDFLLRWHTVIEQNRLLEMVSLQNDLQLVAHTPVDDAAVVGIQIHQRLEHLI